MNVNANVLKRFIIYMAILTFVMFTVWGFVKSFMNRPPGDYETEVCDICLLYTSPSPRDMRRSRMPSSA